MNQIFLIAHNIRSVFNVGSIFRSAEVFGISKIFLTGYTPRPPRKDLSKTALGAENLVSWEYANQVSRVIKKLQSSSVRVVALEITKNAIPLPDFFRIILISPISPIALLVGNEVTGISPALLKSCDSIVAIPLLGEKESLNVAIAASIAMYAIRYSK